MKKLNDLYVSVDNWYKKQDRDFVYLFMNSNTDSWCNRNEFQKLLYWYKEINKLDFEVRDYYLGKKEITLEIVQNHLSDIYQISNEKELIKLAVGDLDDDISYYQIDEDLRISDLLPIIFSYLAYKLNWDRKEFEKHLMNSIQYTEELEDLFVEYTMPSDEEIQKLIEKTIGEQKSRDESEFIQDVKKIIEKYENKDGFYDRVEFLKELFEKNE